jgi:hypothetical protein
MSHVLPDWIAHLLDIPVEAGEGVVWDIDCAWPWWVTLLLAALAAAFVAAVYWHESGRASPARRIVLATMRLAILAILLGMIVQVTLSLKRTGLPYVAVLVDDSQSMTVADPYAEKPRKAMAERLRRAGIEGQPSRWNLARTLLSERDARLARAVADGHKLRVYFLCGPAGPRLVRQQEAADVVEELRTLSAQGASTRLGGGISTILDELRGATLAAVVVLSDGVNTEGPSLADAAQYARRRGVPLYFIGLGSDQPARDLKLSDLLVDEVVFVDDVVGFECKLASTGFEGRKVSVVLREKGNPAVLAKTEVTVGGQPQRVVLQFRPTRVGRFEYVVEAEPQEGERQVENNRQTRTVEVRKEKIRVLLVQASPSFEFRYLRNMLKRDATIALHTVLQDADLEHSEQDAASLRAFPPRAEDLAAYDVVILGDANPALLGAEAMKHLADFVVQPAKGGSLALVAGPSYMPAAFRDTPLAPLMPMAVDRVAPPAEPLTEGFVVQPTDLGLASPAMQLGDTADETRRIWARLPPLYWLLDVPELKPGVRVLAEHPTRVGPDGRRLPVICLQYVGAGKVLFHATDETWRWRYQTGDVYFARYWIQMIRYLCRSKLAEVGGSVVLSTDRREYAEGESVRLRARFADERLAPADDDGVVVVVEQAGQKTQRIALRRESAGRGSFVATLDRPRAGSYHVWMAAPALDGKTPPADFTVVPSPGELARTELDAGAMRRAAEVSGGGYYTFDTAGRLPDALPAGSQATIESLPPRPLWNRWPVLALFLALLIGEWVLRKRSGMV